ncbi:unannotated protein [freshwater metagenome]|uniref:Unannotated protein n=1 Tax=freshwater metagenome TaxID=449393 RepID=A0A6J6EZD1_9ZZZZ
MPNVPSANSIKRSYLPRIAYFEGAPFTGIKDDLTQPPRSKTLPAGSTGAMSDVFLPAK